MVKKKRKLSKKERAWQEEQARQKMEYEKKLAKWLALKKDLESFGVRLVTQSDAVFTDRIGNVLDSGDMICYVAGNTLKVGVFIGLVERYTLAQIQYASGYFWKHGKLDPTLSPTKSVAFSILDAKDKVRIYYPDTYGQTDFQFDKFVVVQKPEFKVGEKGIGRCFTLIDDLKEGILKNYFEQKDDED